MTVSQSNYYEGLNLPKTERKKENDLLLEMIKTLFQKGRGSYGTRRIKRKLAEQGKPVSRRRISRLLRVELDSHAKPRKIQNYNRFKA